MIRVKLECWWTDTPSLNARMMRQFIHETDLENYILVDSKPDYTIVFGRTNWENIETPKDKTFYISQEPLWSPNEPKNDIHNYCSKILISDKTEYPDREEYIETLLPMFYAGRGEWDYREEWDWSKKIKDINYFKDKIISVVVTNNYNSHFYSLQNIKTNKILYEYRTKMGVKLSNNENIHVYGTFWGKNDKNVFGEAWNKHIALNDYKFSISMENTQQKNYISEKFWDVVITDGVPIYLGCTNIEDYVQSDCFINLNGLSEDETLDKINDIIINEKLYYDLYKEKILNLKNEFFKNPTFNLWERIKKLINE
jgi:hypothetical protein